MLCRNGWETCNFSLFFNLKFISELNYFKYCFNNRCAGRDIIKAELLKYGTENIAKEIATIYNKITRTGEHPNEINPGVTTAIQKLGKPRWLIKNLGPINLLSMLRKILAPCLKQNTKHKLDAEILPNQAVYGQGRSTTKHLFTTKILARIAATWQYHTTHLLMRDMSKAFNTIDRAILLQDLQKILDLD